MMRHPITVLIAAAITLALAPVFAEMAGAQSVCTSDGKKLVTEIETTGQALIGSGIGADGSLVQVFGKDGGQWTVIYTRPGSMTCIGGVGTDWQTVAQKLGNPT